MPTYEFNCKKCNKDYETLTKYDESGKYKGVACPHCKSKRKERLVTVATFNFTNPVGTDRWTSDAMGHDYRYNYVLPRIKKEREMADKANAGVNPYKELPNPTGEGTFGFDEGGNFVRE